MKNSFLKTLGLVAALFYTFPNSCAYTNFNEAQKARNNAHAGAFVVDNLLLNGIPAGGAKKWNDFVEGLTPYINTIVAKERGIGQKISDSNKKLLEEAPQAIIEASEPLISTINRSNKLLLSPKREKYPESDLELVQRFIEESHYKDQIAALQKLQKKLAPGATDNQDSRDVKKLLKDTALTLEETYKRLPNDLKKLKVKSGLEVETKVSYIDKIA